MSNIEQVKVMKVNHRRGEVASQKDGITSVSALQCLTSEVDTNYNLLICYIRLPPDNYVIKCTGTSRIRGFLIRRDYNNKRLNRQEIGESGISLRIRLNGSRQRVEVLRKSVH